MSSSTFIKGSNILRSPPSHSKHGMEWEIAPASPGTERTMRLGILFGNLFVLWLRSDTFMALGKPSKHFLAVSIINKQGRSDSSTSSPDASPSKSLFAQLGIKQFSGSAPNLKTEKKLSKSPRALRRMKAQQILHCDLIHCSLDGCQVRAFWLELR